MIGTSLEPAMETVTTRSSVAPSGEGAFSRTVGLLCRALGVFGACLFAGVALLMVTQSTARFLGLPVVGGDEITGWMSASAAFCALPYAFREGALIRMELVLSKLRGPTLRRAELCALVIGTLWCTTMAYAMQRFVWQNAQFGERSTGLISILIWPVQMPAVVASVLLAVAMAEQLVRVWCGEHPLYVIKAERALASDDRHSAGL